jgi:hypothetical protein
MCDVISISRLQEGRPTVFLVLRITGDRDVTARYWSPNPIEQEVPLGFSLSSVCSTSTKRTAYVQPKVIQSLSLISWFPQSSQNVVIEFSIHRLSWRNTFLMHHIISVKPLPIFRSWFRSKFKNALYRRLTSTVLVMCKTFVGLRLA